MTDTAKEKEQRMIARIIALICATYGVTEDQLLSVSRSYSISHPRQIAMHLIRSLTTLSLEAIGQRFTTDAIKRDHSSTESALRQVRQRMKDNVSYNAQVRRLTRELRNASHDESRSESETCPTCGRMIDYTT
jgi:chromosomal replication initiator protein